MTCAITSRCSTILPRALTRGWFHSYGACGFHPSRFARSSGQRIYRWRVNRILEASTADLRLADEGEDVGRMRRVLSDELDPLASAMAEEMADTEPEVPHAIALFRRHHASREDRRSAVVALARVLEDRRRLIRRELLRRDEGALFDIANKFDLRHRRADQMTNYGDEYLDWIFHWYLATIVLLERMRARSEE